MVGGATVVSVAIGIVRTKFLAIVIGPSGIALFGLYGAILDLAVLLSGMGIQTSGVRLVAEANSQDNLKQISRTIITLRRCAILLGVLGAVGLILFRAPISRLTFGDDSHEDALAMLSLAIFFTAISQGQTALIQGLRRIADLAAIKVVGAFLGTLATIPLIWWLRDQGIVPSMVAVAGILLSVSWWFARRVRVELISVSLKETYIESKALLGLGFAFMLSGLMVAATTYFIRTSITFQLGLDAAGYYQAAFALSGVYVGIILGAMAADFYPRLTAVASDDKTCNRLVNEQSEIALLIAGPGIVATLAFAPLVVRLLYSVEFVQAIDVLRWQIFGLLGRIVSWPLGFVILAKGRGRVFIATELVANLLHVGFVILFMKKWGLVGTGIAFFALYVHFCVLIRLVVGQISGFQWTNAYLRLLTLYFVAVFSAFTAPYFLDARASIVIGVVFTCLVTLYSCHALYRLVGRNAVLSMIEKTPLKFFSRHFNK